MGVWVFLFSFSKDQRGFCLGGLEDPPQGLLRPTQHRQVDVGRRRMGHEVAVELCVQNRGVGNKGCPLGKPYGKRHITDPLRCSIIHN